MRGFRRPLLTLAAALLSGCATPAIVKPDASEGPEYCAGYDEGRRAAETRSDGSGLTTGAWLVSIPCFVVGLGMRWSAAHSEFEPPPELIAGKPTEYVRGFRDAFQARARARRVHAATVGTCLGATTLVTVAGFAAVAYLASMWAWSISMGWSH
jgi:hypothetical protein